MSFSYILSACRTPIGKFLGSLSALPAPQLAATAIDQAIARSGSGSKKVDEVILGNVLSAGLGQAPARQAALAAGLPPTIVAMTVNKVCGSGLEAVTLADRAIRAGDAQIVVAGGNGKYEPRPAFASGHPRRLETRQSRSGRFDDPRWTLVRV